MVISINKHLAKTRHIILIFFVLGCAGISFLTTQGSNLFSWVASPFFWLAYTLFLAAVYLNAYVNQQKKIVFSTDNKMVFSQSLLGKKHLMAFDDIGAIKPYSTSFGGTYFALFSRENLYGRNPVRISPFYSGGAKSLKEYAEFEENTLPQLWQLIETNLVDKPTAVPAIADGRLVYYQKENDMYRLKSVYNRDSWLYTVTAVMLGLSVLILMSPVLRLKWINAGIGLGLGAGILAFLLTEKKYFQQGQLVSEYASGLLRKAYPLRAFSTFQIIHRRYNFVYVGTDINAVFGQQKGAPTIFLCQIRKTEQIEAFLNETRFIIDQQEPVH